MAVIPLTLTISLCLVATFVLFFLRESAHRVFSSSEHDSLLPLADETATIGDSAAPQSNGSKTGTAKACGCSSHDHEVSAHAPCERCQRRERARRSAESTYPVGAQS